MSIYFINNKNIFKLLKIYFINYYKGELKSIEDFFSLYCYLKRPSEIPADHKLMLFRSDKKPLWEEYPDGGTWVVAMKRKDEEDLNKKWE
jgi:hypothetical protein